MGDILSKIEEEYFDYKLLCQKYNETPVDIYKDWYKHFIELERKDGN